MKNWRKAEAGYTITFQAVYYTVMLFVFFALIYDFGGLGYTFSVTSNVARLAAQDAAKDVDTSTFVTDQQIRLSPDALTRAQAYVDGMTNGQMTITSLTINHLDTRDVIALEAYTTVNLPVLHSLFGMPPITLWISAYAEPAYGISQEGQ
ncbi:MAG: hypothetical protein M1434_12155 [Chloroflexi bacterium]|nr:hypothetical protein [Chloroflexota bacterium]MCL5275475.1 hypothetical protein [Chloroflexota bacterium]